ncbi:MAG: hypothetical protein KAI28_12175, partial [Sphingomonadales bacterium]|nr:hypothetical protein [Sphingomonadales bacterium]
MNMAHIETHVALDLVDRGVIDDQLLKHIQQQVDKSDKALLRALSSHGHVADDVMAQSLAQAMDATFLSLGDILATTPAIEGLSLSFLKDRHILPIKADGEICVLITGLDDIEAVTLIERALGSPIPLTITTPDALDQAFQHFFPCDDDTLRT